MLALLVGICFVLAIVHFNTKRAAGEFEPISEPASGSYVTAIPVQVPVVPKFIPRRRYLNSFGQCSCVEYIKARLGIVGTFGNARAVKPDTQIPEVGSVILFVNHVGFVVGWDGTTVTYDDYNYIACGERRGVTILASDPSIRGYK